MGLTPTVVDGNPITSAWGNEVRDRTTQVFASAAERDSQYTSPPDGAFAVTLDDGLTHQRLAGAWYPTAGLVRQARLSKTLTCPVGNTAAAPPAVAGFWTVAAGVVTFLKPGVYLASLSANRGTTMLFYAALFWTVNGVAQPEVRVVHTDLGGKSYATAQYSTYAAAGDKCTFYLNNYDSATMNLIATSSLVYMGAAPGPIDT